MTEMDLRLQMMRLSIATKNYKTLTSHMTKRPKVTSKTSSSRRRKTKKREKRARMMAARLNMTQSLCR